MQEAWIKTVELLAEKRYRVNVLIELPIRYVEKPSAKVLYRWRIY